MRRGERRDVRLLPSKTESQTRMVMWSSNYKHMVNQTTRHSKCTYLQCIQLVFRLCLVRVSSEAAVCLVVVGPHQLHLLLNMARPYQNVPTSGREEDRKREGWQGLTKLMPWILVCSVK